MIGAKGGASGGTIASMLNMLEQSAVDPSLADMLADDYSLNPNSRADPICQAMTRFILTSV